MLLKDNFIHADLHPGNILVREVGNSSGSSSSGSSSSSMATGRLAALAPLQQAWRRLASYVDFQPKLILLDTGMIAELSGPDQRSLVKFFTSLTKQVGVRQTVGRLLGAVRVVQCHTVWCRSWLDWALQSSLWVAGACIWCSQHHVAALAACTPSSAWVRVPCCDSSFCTSSSAATTTC
jgi:hypothetical protein